MQWEGIDMNNPNTLVALAYIKTNDNPLLIFCNYILASLISAPGQTLRNDELLKKLDEKFGLKMKQSTVNNCISILKKSGEVKYLPKGSGYALGQTDFDVKQFEESMKRLHVQEDAVIAALIQFVHEKYGVSWDVEKAKSYLSVFLNEQGNATKLFLDGEIDTGGSKLGESWYIGRFINDIQESDRIEKVYLEDITNGLMIYQGIYQTNDYQQDKTQKFKGTVFYFDTKMVLRLLGYSVEMHVRATRELVQMIREDYGGKVGIFDKTVGEVVNALDSAGKCYQNRKPILDRELAVFAGKNPAEASLMCEVSGSIDNLLRKYGVIREPVVIWEADRYHKYWLKTDEVEGYIKRKFDWREGAVSNDVQVINQINILREGDYTIRYGGQKKRPVFVTTNTALVYSFREYVEEQIKADDRSYWNLHALPVITESMLVTRLWVPYARKYSDLPALTLARYAYAAQNPTTGFFEKLKDLAVKYRETANIDILNVDELRKRQLDDILVVKTQGDVDALTVEMVASSVEEFAQMQNISLLQEIAEGQETIRSKDASLSEAEESIIRLAAKPYVNKLGWRRLIIWAAKYWWILITLFFQVGAYFIGEQSSNRWLPHLIALVPMVVEAVLAVLDKCFEERRWHVYILRCAVTYVWKKYAENVKRGIQQEKECYWNDIILCCRKWTPVFAKYEEWCKDGTE